MTESVSPSRPPVPATPLSGRLDELAVLERLLAGPRLVTVVGAPGVGKSRLALEVAWRTEREARYVALAGLTEPEDVVAAVDAALSPVTQDERTMLVVDNADHVREWVSVRLEQAMQQHPRMRVLCTSRVPLLVPGEQVCPLGPLATKEAVELFEERAARSGADLSGPDGLVARICERLDRLPLALEIAASWTRGLGVAGVLEQLEQTVAHGSVMAETVASSMDALGPSEQDLFALLSVFVGEFDLDAVATVAGHSAATLTTLVDHSLVQTRCEAHEGRLRYRLLEPLRQQAAARLGEDGHAVRRRHAEHYAAVAHRGEEALRGPAYAAALARLARDEGNLLAAASWTRTHDPDTCLALATDLARYWEHRGRVRDARVRLARALDARPDAAADRRGVAYARLGRLAYRARDYPAARAALQRAEAIMRGLGNDGGVARALSELALVETVAGEPERGRSLCDESIATFRRCDDAVGEAWACTVLALVEFVRGDVEEVRLATQRVLSLTGPDRPAALTMTAHLWIACSAALAGDVAAHRRHVTVALAHIEEAGAAIGDPDWIWGGCHLAVSEGRLRAALRLAGAAEALERRGGTQSAEPVVSGLCRDAVRTASAGLGRRAAARYAAQGARMTTPELMAEALAEPGPADRVLSVRELEVAELVGCGLGNEEIAGRLHLSRRTVETHVENCRLKLDLDSRFQLAVWAVERRLAREDAQSG